MNGLVSDIQRFSVNDGYGIRTIVFLAGCAMNCAWCQNPEMIGKRPALMYNAGRCGGCGVCIEVCPAGAACAREGCIEVDRDRCISCLHCVEQCIYEARLASCRWMTAREVIDAVLRDETFFKNTGGGLTVSGGEPLIQKDFCAELLRLAKNAGIHTAVETAGNVAYESFKTAAPLTDLFLYDIKLINGEKHRKWTGVSNEQILRNFEKLCETNVEIIVRVPLIPGINDGEEFHAIADHVSGFKSVKEMHILPYHTIGGDKYKHLGMAYKLDGQDDENDIETDNCRKYAESLGFRVSVGGAGF